MEESRQRTKSVEGSQPKPEKRKSRKQKTGPDLPPLGNLLRKEIAAIRDPAVQRDCGKV
jgi:hypothetical protein